MYKFQICIGDTILFAPRDAILLESLRQLYTRFIKRAQSDYLYNFYNIKYDFFLKKIFIKHS